MRKNIIISFVLLCVLQTGVLFSQDFGFGFDDEETAGSANKALNVSVGGEVSASLLGYVDDFSKGLDNTRLGDIFSGKLKFFAGTSFAEGVINLKLQTTSQQPVSIDEGYVRAYFGSLEIEGGLRKLTWGKADSFGPLDVINPLDYSELTDLSDTMNLKIARPLIHASYRIGSFSKIEGVFVPTFEPMRYAEEGRWQPSQFKNMFSSVETGITSMAMEKFGPNASNPALLPILSPVFDNVKDSLLSYFNDNPINYPSTDTLEYFQAGIRFTTTIGSADIGGQYFYGNLSRPSFTIAGIDAYLDDLRSGILGSFPPTINPAYRGKPNLISPKIKYNRYHQIGADWAQVLFGFNIRAEAAVNITEDTSGDDGSVYNPAFLWSLGFDRDLVWGINLNVQCNESLRLMNDKIGNDPLLDTEAGTKMTFTQIIAALSKKFLRDELEARVAVLWGIEDSDFLLMPALIWTKDALSVEFSAGIFGGNEEGQFGQYRNNSFVKAVLTYSF